MTALLESQAQATMQILSRQQERTTGFLKEYVFTIHPTTTTKI